MTETRIQLEIADLVFQFNTDGLSEKNLPEKFRPHACKGGQPDVELDYIAREPSEKLEGELVFEDPPVWSLRKAGEELIFKSRFNPVKPENTVTESALRYDPEIGKGTLNVKDLGQSHYLQERIDLSSLEAFFLHFFSGGLGVLLHSSSVVDGDGATVFCGEAGRGKTTISKLFQKRDALSDDKTAVRKAGGGFTAYCVPWQRHDHVSRKEGFPLKKIFFLKHAKENSVNELTLEDKVGRALAASFTPQWSKEGMEFTLNFLADLMESVPAFELGFKPTEEVVDFVRSI